jgi:uncharacterized protein
MKLATINTPASATTMLPTGVAQASWRRGLAIYLGVTFAFSWLLLGVSVAAAAANTAPPLPDVLLITLATLGPLLGALTASASRSGRAGVRALLKQLVRWRVPLRLYGVAVFGPAAVTGLAFLLWLVLGGRMIPAPEMSTLLLVPVLLAVVLLPALFEEAGWRGYLQPELQARYRPWGAIVITGTAHAVWHIPVFLIPGAGFGTLPFALFALFVLGLAVVQWWIYNRSGGSVLICGVMHAAFNTWPVVWTAGLVLLPENERGIHVQIPMAIVLACWAALVALALRRAAAQTEPVARAQGL